MHLDLDMYQESVTTRVWSAKLRFLYLTVVLALLSACSSTYYDAMEKLGYEKRDILVNRVRDAGDAQNNAQETFRSALEQFQSVVDTPDTPLKAKYEKVQRAYDSSEAAARNVRRRVGQVEDVAKALFKEWGRELRSYESLTLRRSSEQKLGETRRDYEQLIGSMQETTKRMDPVLRAFQDQVLYLKHNLNAQAIASLESELGQMRQDVDVLIREMERSVAESEAFILRLQRAGD